MSEQIEEDALSPGLIRALSKQKVRTTCACGFPMPTYPGRYPSKCPVCQSPREKDDDGESTASA